MQNFQNRVYCYKKEFAPQGNKFFLLEVNTLEEGRQK